MAARYRLHTAEPAGSEVADVRASGRGLMACDVVTTEHYSGIAKQATVNRIRDGKTAN